jgi:hypothetical protein
MDGALSSAATVRRIVTLFLGIAMIVSIAFASSVHRPGSLRLVENHPLASAAPTPQTP